MDKSGSQRKEIIFVVSKYKQSIKDTSFALFPVITSEVSFFSCIKRADPEAGTRYGFASGKEIEPGILKVKNLVEKPGLGKQPTPYAIVSGFLFMPSIFENLKKAVKKFGYQREIFYNVDGVLPDIGRQPVYALEIKNAKYYDTGNKLEYLKTVVDFGLKDQDLGENFKKYLRQLSG